MPMEDIIDRADIEKIVRQFYSIAMTNKDIGFFFTDVVALNLDLHMPVICDFWESILFGTGTYRGNPMIKHIELSRLHKIERRHFDSWLRLWKTTINQLHSGQKADEMILKSQTMAKLMLYKIEQSTTRGFIQ